MALYFVLSLLVVPVLSCLPFLKSRRPAVVWFALLINAAVFLVVSFLFYPYRLTDLAELLTTQECDFTTIYWLYLFVPLQFAISLVVTAGAYLFLSKRGRRNAN